MPPAPRRPSYPPKPHELARLQALERSPDFRVMDEHERTAVRLAKWQAVHDFFERFAFDAGEGRRPRAEQWRAVLRLVDASIGERALSDWVREQVEIAEHLAAGIPDLRPRSNGPCHQVLMRHLRGRVAKANAIHNWVLAAEGRVECGWPDFSERLSFRT